MRKSFLFIFIVTAFAVKAQTYSINPAKTVTFTAALNNITINDIYQTNTGTGSITLVWEKVSISVPPQWQYSMCDLGTCYPGLPTGPTTMNVVAPGAQGFLGLNIDPGNTPGSGVVKVRVYQSGFVANADTLTWYVNANAVGINEVSINNSVKIYPNPASDYFYVELNKITEVKNACLTDALGKKVMSPALSTDKKINISELDKGIYFLNIETTEGRILKRIIKE